MPDIGHDFATMQNHRYFEIGEVLKKIGGADRDRTDDLHVANVALSQLSYGPAMIVVAKFYPATESRG